jgi:hypothetical protein
MSGPSPPHVGFAFGATRAPTLSAKCSARGESTRRSLLEKPRLSLVGWLNAIQIVSYRSRPVRLCVSAEARPGKAVPSRVSCTWVKMSSTETTDG